MSGTSGTSGTSASDDGRRTSRRTFLGRVGAGAAAGAAGVAAIGLPGAGAAYPANDTIGVGAIGCGGRVQGSLLPKTLALPGTDVRAVCDIYDRNRGRAAEIVRAQGGDPAQVRRHEDVLARSDIDAVIIGTPDHWHVPLSVAACRAGKDVYCEKPLTHDLEEGRSIVAAQDEGERMVQVGTQQRSMPHLAEAREVIRAGTIGDVHKVHMTWNRNFLPFRKWEPEIDPATFDWKRFLGRAPEQPFDAYRALGNWRWFWDFGAGILGDLMVHWLDYVNWVLDLPAPTRAMTAGDSYAAGGVWETPDTIETILEYPESGVIAHFAGTFVNQHEKAGVTFMGTKGTVYCDRGRYELYPEPRGGIEPRENIGGSGAKGADFDVDGTSLHLADWLESVRSREKPVAPAEAGVVAADAAHFANRAFRERRLMTREGA